ncbi:A disintegrin and metalloproteinase with thrombospondin motifs 12-like [Hyperolius riggenbachi]|uniref:A disintegrin and metalloproteinase with thrombospondin motifs 12-like n=1 Tax=Hyperolius riggenbachi TaxID=752182 RepID=UPI0035A3C6E9
MHCVQKDWITRICFLIHWLGILGSCHGENLQQAELHLQRKRQDPHANNLPPDYEVVEPVKVDKNGEFLSNSLTHHYEIRQRRKRDSHSDAVHYRILQGTKELYFNLTPNEGFLSDNYILERRRGSSSGVEISPRSGSLCHFSGSVQQRDAGSGYAAISTCNGLAGFFHLPHGDYFIEPLYNAPAAGKQHQHIIYKKKAYKSHRRRRDLPDAEIQSCGVNGRRSV